MPMRAIGARLGEVADRPQSFADLAVADIFAVDENLAPVEPLEMVDEAQQRALAAAARAP